jgi:hypothetical protein
MDLDINEIETGMLSGKAAALADWRFRKDQRDFRKLCERLAQRNRRRANPDRFRSAARLHYARHRERYMAMRAARRAQLRATCHQCGCRFAPCRLKPAKWCTKKCANAYWAKHRKSRNRGLRNRQLTPTLIEALRASPWLTLSELLARTGTKYRSTAGALTVACQVGILIHDGRKMDRRYAAPGAQLPIAPARKREWSSARRAAHEGRAR